MKKRTDLALEAREIWSESASEQTELPGVKAREEDKNGFKVTVVEILNEQGSKELCKPMGKYVTIELGGLIRREDEAFARCAETVSETLRDMMGGGKKTVLVAGLGNRRITPDAVGPEVISNIMVTRHLTETIPEHFKNFNRIAAVETGVLAATGIESAAVIKALCREIAPELVIVVDALVSRNISRVCRTIQIADSGIVPGSGVGNSREEISEKTLGRPVLAVGIPTVVDAGTMAMDAAEEAGVPEDIAEKLGKIRSGMIVTPKDIDENITNLSRVTGYGIDMALQPGLSVGDINMFLS